MEQAQIFVEGVERQVRARVDGGRDADHTADEQEARPVEHDRGGCNGERDHHEADRPEADPEQCSVEGARATKGASREPKRHSGAWCQAEHKGAYLERRQAPLAVTPGRRFAARPCGLRHATMVGADGTWRNGDRALTNFYCFIAFHEEPA